MNIPNQTTKTNHLQEEQFEWRKSLFQFIEKLNDSYTFGNQLVDHVLLHIFTHNLHFPMTPSLSLQQLLIEQIQKCDRKSSMIVLKWLIYLHQILTESNNKNTIDQTQILLFAIKINHKKSIDRFQNHLKQKLVTPYLTYLIKLSCLLQIKYSHQNTLLERTYAQLNLLLFCSNQFSNTAQQFHPFFSQCHPFLLRYHTLLTKNIANMFANVQNSYEQSQMIHIGFLEIERLATALEQSQLKQRPQIKQEIPSDQTTDLTFQLTRLKFFSPIKDKYLSTAQDLQGTELPLNF